MIGSRTTLACFAAALVLACSPARKKVQGDIVRSVRFDGNAGAFSGQNDYQIKGAMEQGDSGFGIATIGLNYLTKPVLLKPEALERDSFRLETWYASHGWFDARFLGWEIHQIRRQSFERAGMVRILGHVDPGEPSLVRSFEVRGTQGAAERVFASTIKRTGFLQPEGQFSLLTVDLTQSQLLTLFANNGYPYASVNSEVRAFPEDRVVDVVFDVDAGITARVGAITVQGAAAVEPEIVRETLPFKTGDTYDAETLRRGQQRLFALGTYAIVNIVPDLSDPTQRDVPVTIELTETRFQTLRLGGGSDLEGSVFKLGDGGELTPRLSMQYDHVHLFDRLIQGRLSGSVGYAYDITGDQPPDTPVSFRVEASVSTPRLAGPKWGLSAATSLTQARLVDQYAYFNPQTSLRVLHRVNDSVSIDVGPTLQFYKILGEDNGGLTARSLFGADFDGSYRLVTVDVGFTADWRDDPLDTTRGTYYRASFRQALPFLSQADSDQSFVFTDVGGEARTYRRIRTGGRQPFTLAMRARGRIQISESRDAEGNAVGVPYPERLFQGGSADLRGFRIHHVGPYETVCTYAPKPSPGRVANPFQHTPTADNELFRRFLPVGGEVDALLSAEARFALPYGLTFVPFVDGGLLSPSVREIAPSQARIAGGIGLRYASLVGPIRIDLAVRPLYPEDRAPRAIFGCEAADIQPRGLDFLSSFFGQSGPERSVPFAVNLIVTIGHSF